MKSLIMVDNTSIISKINSLKKGDLTCEDNLNNFLDNIKDKNTNFKIVLDLKEDQAIKRAKELDERRKQGKELGKLFGLVFLIKSNISVKGFNVSCASKTLESYEGTFNADVIDKLLDEGAIILGTVNHDEFASGATGELGPFGPTKNPKTPSRVPGGSSSGSAAAVAANFCDISLGSDTGGSIRVPSSHCGVIGLKPTYGRVSRYGLIDLAMSFDQIYPLSNDIHGISTTLEVISGKSENDSTSENIPVLEFSKINPIKKFNIGIIESLDDMIKSPKIKDLYNKKIKLLESSGHNIKKIKIDKLSLGIQAYYPIVYVEFFSGTRKFDGVKYGKKIEDSAREEVVRRILGGKEVSKSEYEGAYYKKALKVRELLSEDFSRAFQEVDFIVTPATPLLPHKVGKEISIEENYAYDAFTTPINLAGVCSGVISKDTVEDEGEDLYVGFQVIAGKFKEENVLTGMKILNKL